MAYLPRVQECKNGCGASIYFDRDSRVSHPSQDRWIPLEYNEDTGVYTGEKHNCPKYSNGNGHSQQQPQQHQGSTTIISEHSQLKIIADKLDLIIKMLEKQQGAMN